MGKLVQSYDVLRNQLYPKSEDRHTKYFFSNNR